MVYDEKDSDCLTFWIPNNYLSNNIKMLTNVRINYFEKYWELFTFEPSSPQFLISFFSKKKIIFIIFTIESTISNIHKKMYKA